MKIKTSKTFTDLKGTEMKVKGYETYGIFLGELVMAHKGSTAIKKLVFAQKLVNADDELEIDVADLSFLKDVLKSTNLFSEKYEGFNTLFNGQVEIYLEGLKEEDNEKNV